MKNAILRIARRINYPILAAISLVAYLAASQFLYGMGFPLDDAWIHQTYARNLGLLGEWAYLAGEPSAGSTAPLWSGLLAIGHYLRLGPYLWTYFLGWVFLSAVVMLGINLVRKMEPNNEKWGGIAGILLVFEWHLVWAATSGMETTLFTSMVLVVFALILAKTRRWFFLGGITGLSIYARPDGLTLIGPVVMVLILEKTGWRRKLYRGLEFLAGFGLLFGPYLLANSALSGSYWPNTFYAKQAEYSIELLDPLWRRLFEQFGLPLVGVGVVLLPGFIYFLYQAVLRKSWERLGICIWAIGYLIMFALRLPVTYQHGRYAIPMMPAYFICGLIGTLSSIRLNSPNLYRRVVSRSLVIAGGMVLFSFWFLGARAYARDVAIIESEMVNTARWVAANIERNSVIAAHDIGALGYFTQHRLVDLAGLVSPEIIPFIRDEERLAEYLDEQKVDYLVTFPGWYPLLVKKAIPVFRTNALYAPQQGGENMGVYQWGHIAIP